MTWTKVSNCFQRTKKNWSAKLCLWTISNQTLIAFFYAVNNFFCCVLFCLLNTPVNAFIYCTPHSLHSSQFLFSSVPIQIFFCVQTKTLFFFSRSVHIRKAHICRFDESHAFSSEKITIYWCYRVSHGVNDERISNWNVKIKLSHTVGVE